VNNEPLFSGGKMSQLKQNQVTDVEVEIEDLHWKSLYKVGGTVALIVIMVALLDIIITFSPGGATGSGTLTVIDWFTLFQDNWFLGLRNLGLFNVMTTALMVPLFLALYAAHRRVNKAYAALAAILFFIGTAIYIASNQALPILTLSGQYAAATTESQKALLVAAGQVMLAQAEDFTPGAFMGFLFPSVGGIMMAVVMLRGGIFSRLTAWVGILGSGFLLIFTICATFVPASFDAVMILAMAGGLLTMAYYIGVAHRLFQLGQGVSQEQK
jgi:hypothetical protein